MHTECGCKNVRTCPRRPEIGDGRSERTGLGMSLCVSLSVCLSLLLGFPDSQDSYTVTSTKGQQCISHASKPCIIMQRTYRTTLFQPITRHNVIPLASLFSPHAVSSMLRDPLHLPRSALYSITTKLAPGMQAVGTSTLCRRYGVSRRSCAILPRPVIRPAKTQIHTYTIAAKEGMRWPKNPGLDGQERTRMLTATRNR